MKKQSDEILATLTIELPDQVLAGKPTTVVLKKPKKPRKPPVKPIWRDKVAIEGAVKMDLWCPPQCYALAWTIIKQFGSTDSYAADTPLPVNDFPPDVMQVIDSLMQALFKSEKVVLERAEAAEKRRQNKLLEKLYMEYADPSMPEPTLPPPVLADDALIQFRNRLGLALKPHMASMAAKVDARVELEVLLIKSKLTLVESELADRDLKIKELQTKCRQLERQCLESEDQYKRLRTPSLHVEI